MSGYEKQKKKGERKEALKQMRGSLLKFMRKDMKSDSASSSTDPLISNLENKAAAHTETDVTEGCVEHGSSEEQASRSGCSRSDSDST